MQHIFFLCNDILQESPSGENAKHRDGAKGIVPLQTQSQADNSHAKASAGTTDTAINQALEQRLSRT